MKAGEVAYPHVPVRLGFQGLPSPVLVSPQLLPLFEQHFALWPFSVHAGEGGALFHAEEKGAGFVLRCASGRRERYASAAELLCDAGVELAEAAAKAAGLFCLHCAAVSVDGRLFLLPGVNRSGKSLLAASFLLGGGRVFADDLLAVGPDGVASSFGLPPRLRLPLPQSSSHLAAALPSIPGVGDGRYRFLYAGDGGVASFGESLPVAAVVIPRRTEGVKPRLRRLSPAAGLQSLAYQFQIAKGQAGAVFALTCRLCGDVPVWLLEYDAAEEAAAFMMRAADRICSGAEAPLEASLWGLSALADSDRVRPPRRGAFPSAKDVRWARAPGVASHDAEGGLYLIPQEEDGIFYLDAMGRALWMLLEEPLDVREAADLLTEVFPQAGRLRLEADISRFFRTLWGQGLLRAAD